MRALPVADPQAPQSQVQRRARRAMASPAAVAGESSLPFRLVVWRLAPLLMRLTGGRFAGLLPMPVTLLETRDLRDGSPHRRCVIYFNDRDRVIVIPSKGGHTEDPYWYRNALAEPEVQLESRPFLAAPVTDADELRRLWALADDFYPACVEYRRRAARTGRTIPILQLHPR